jgi:hypothetical protein
MRNVSIFVVVVVAIAIHGCGSDRQLETQPNSTTQIYGAEGIQRSLANVDLSNLLSNGKRYEVRFTLDSGLEAADLVFMESGSAFEESLRVDGFDGPLTSLAIGLGLTGQTPDVLLHIRTDGIFDGKGNRLIDQEPAPHGYAWRVDTSSKDALYPSISFLSVILLDVNGAGASDELYIYWKSSPQKQGSFIVTNIPNEIM